MKSTGGTLSRGCLKTGILRIESNEKLGRDTVPSAFRLDLEVFLTFLKRLHSTNSWQMGQAPSLKYTFPQAQIEMDSVLRQPCRSMALH
jgi:hypothetical protein